MICSVSSPKCYIRTVYFLIFNVNVVNVIDDAKTHNQLYYAYSIEFARGFESNDMKILKSQDQSVFS